MSNFTTIPNMLETNTGQNDYEEEPLLVRSFLSPGLGRVKRPIPREKARLYRGVDVRPSPLDTCP
jgi:hypothetical protein